jgi:hypothetical protein
MVSVKPEVVAPGSFIRVARGTNAGGGFHSLSGTSFATPHVSGAAALLYEANPLLTGDEIKFALLNSALDLGMGGEDNTYGMGVIDLPAALGRIGVPTRPAISIVGVEYDGPDRNPDPGETVEIVLTLRNGGTSVSSLEAVLTTGHPRVTIGQPNASFGTLASGTEENNFLDPFRVDFDASGSDTLQFSSVVGTVPGGDSATHNIGNVEFTVTNFGQYGYFNGARMVGKGFRFPRDGTNWLFHGAFLAGTGASRVSDGTDGGTSDWRVLPGGNLTLSNAGEIGDQEGYAAYHDGGAVNPIGLEVLQRSFAWSDNANADFILLVFFIINSSATATIGNLHNGIYFDWDLDILRFDQNFVDWDPENALGFMWSDLFDEYVGISLLSHTPTSYRAIDNPAFVYDGFSDSEKFGFLSGGFAFTRGGTPNDWSQMLSVGPFTLEPDDTMSVVFAVMGGESLSDIRNNAVAARGKYEEIRDLLPLTIIPPRPPVITGDLDLAQNYPNPFAPAESPETTIAFRVTQPSESDSLSELPVAIRIFDSRGRQVRLLVEPSNLPPGEYSVQWDGKDDRGAVLPSGVYFYRLEVGALEVTRKLVILR